MNRTTARTLIVSHANALEYHTIVARNLCRRHNHWAAARYLCAVGVSVEMALWILIQK